MSGPFGSSQWMYKSGDYEIANSLRMNDADVPELLWPASSHSGGNRRTFTHSLWVKRGIISSTHQVIFEARDGDDGSSDNIKWEDGQLAVIYQDGTLGRLKSTALFRDSNAWYHIVVAVDTTQGTNTNRIKVYVNGVQLTSFTGTNTYMDQNADTRTSYASSDQQYGNTRHPENDYGLDGYLAEVNFVDGLQLTPASFAETDDDYGHWKPKKYAGAYGDEGYYLDFKSSGVGTAGTGTIGADRSGNGNHFTSDNVAATDQMLDSPTNNFATYNPLHADSTGTFSEGNLKHAAGGQVPNISSMAMASGKWYAEFYCVSGTYTRVGIANELSTGIYGGNLGATAGSWAKINNAARLYHSGNATTYGAEWDAGQIAMVAFDADAGKIWYGVNGTWDASGNPATAANPSQSSVTGTDFFFATTSGSGTLTYVANFGQDSSFAGNTTAQGNQDGNSIGDFTYTPPSGFLALCTKNLPDVAVTPSEHFNTVLWTGNGSSQSISSLEFQPDFTWIKSRSIVDSNHLFDSVRGAGQRLRSDSTAAENYNETAYLTSFDSDGFSLGGDDGVNKNTATYVAWNWKAGGNAASVGSNTDGSINTTDTSANVDAGFSISTWTGNATSGASVGHGLSKAPEMIINKCRSSAGNWAVYHASNTSEPETEYLELETTAATADIENIWNDQAPTNSVFYLGNNASVNGNGETFVTYCFHSVDGYSKVGSYVGNGNANGTFVYTGFKPMMVISKYTGTENWNIIDTKRSPHNLMEDLLKPDVNDAEIDTQIDIDFLSNGFKPRINSGFLNGNGHTIIYIAWAETPFKYSTAR